MTCRPGTLIRIGGVETASVGGIMLNGADAYALTAGHACAARIGQPVEYRENGAWHPLGTVTDFRSDGFYDAGVISTEAALVDPRPPGMNEELSSFPYDEIANLKNEVCDVVLGQTHEGVVGRITAVTATEFSLEFTLDPGATLSTNGDSGSPLIFTRNGARLLAGILIERPQGSRQIHFIHPTPALNAMKVAIP